MSVVEIFVIFYNHILSSVLTIKDNTVSEIPHWPEALPFYDDKHRSCHRATLHLYSTYLAGFALCTSLANQPNSRTPWISEFLTRCMNILLSLSIILKSQGRGSALIPPVTISAFAACYLKNFFDLFSF